MSLYAPFDTQFPDDPKVIKAGYVAELVYIRCVLKCREALSDGVIDRARIDRWCVGIPNPKKEAARLVKVGLLLLHPDGWQIPPDVWRKWNPLKAEVQAKRDAEAQRKRDYRDRRKQGVSQDCPNGTHSPVSHASEQPEPEPKESQSQSQSQSHSSPSTSLHPAHGNVGELIEGLFPRMEDIA